MLSRHEKNGIDAFSTQRRLLASFCLLAPVLVYGVGFLWLGMTYFFPDELKREDFAFDLAKDKLIVFSNELIARERLFLSSIAVSVAAIAAAIYAISTFERNRGLKNTIYVVVLSFACGMLATMFTTNPVRELVVEWPLLSAKGAEASFGLARFHEGIGHFGKINSFCALAATTALIARFVDITLGDGRWDGQSGIEARGVAIRETILFAGILLTLATVATYFYYHYPLSLMTKEAAEIHRRFSEVASLRWGAMYSSIMVTASTPAIAAHLLARQRLARLREERQRQEGGADKQPAPLITWESFGIVARAVVAFAAMLAPAAISPILESFNAG